MIQNTTQPQAIEDGNGAAQEVGACLYITKFPSLPDAEYDECSEELYDIADIDALLAEQTEYRAAVVAERIHQADDAAHDAAAARAGLRETEATEEPEAGAARAAAIEQPKVKPPKLKRGPMRDWYIKLRNKSTGETIEVNNQEASLKRLRKRIFSWCDAVNPLASQVGSKTRLVMITLTYREGEEWQPRHMTRFIQRLRKEIGDNLLAYAWVMELQERGAPHYHLLAYVRVGTRIPMPDKAGLWEHGSTRIETAKKPGYIAKYAQKIAQKGGNFPKGARKFAVWLSKTAFTHAQRWALRLATLPGWLADEMRKLATESDDTPFPKRATGVGWVIPETGQIFQSLWELVEVLTGVERELRAAAEARAGAGAGAGAA